MAEHDSAAGDGARTGWYGKLPSLGDFASRRLAPELIEAWDDWLAEGLAHWRERDPEGWLAAYLAGPTWRFVLAPGLLPGQTGALAGVLMPSVDRVGRYFPLTLLRPVDAAVPSEALMAWLHRLDDLALDAMQDDWSVEQLEAELGKLDAATPAVDSDPTGTRLPAPGAGQACWWREGAEGQPLPWLGSGLPQHDQFAALLSGQFPDTSP